MTANDYYIIAKLTATHNQQLITKFIKTHSAMVGEAAEYQQYEQIIQQSVPPQSICTETS